MKTAGDKNRYKQDVDGQWWWYGKNKGRCYRVRAFFAICEFCKEEFLLTTGRKDRRYCGHSCCRKAFMEKYPDFFTGKNHHAWTGGRIKNKGYIVIHSPDHPACQGNKRKYIAEHRLIMEKHLGRYLKPYESIHHINGKKDDNRLENLELWTKVHPYGVRNEDIPHCPTCTCGKLTGK